MTIEWLCLRDLRRAMSAYLVDNLVSSDWRYVFSAKQEVKRRMREISNV